MRVYWFVFCLDLGIIVISTRKFGHSESQMPELKMRNSCEMDTYSAVTSKLKTALISL